MLNIFERLLKKKERKQHTKRFIRKLDATPHAFAPHTLINLHGAPKTGKTIWAKIFSSHFNTPLEIDCKDPRIAPYLPNASDSLTHFIKTHHIDLLILDGLTPSTIAFFSLEMLQEEHKDLFILLISEEPLIQQHYTLTGIDFEEYMSFSYSKNPQQLFNAFLLDGTLPEIPFTEESKKNQRKREILLLSYKPELLMALLPFMGQAITPHHLYIQLKKNLSLSKDTLYATIKQYKKQSMLYELPKLNAPHAPKKLYFWDFTLFNAISYNRNFVALFENMIFLELIKHTHEIYYSPHLDFIIKQDHNLLGIVAAPFLMAESITKKLNKILKENLDLKRILIITLGNAQEDKSSPIPYIMLPFWEFALGEYEK